MGGRPRPVRRRSTLRGHGRYRLKKKDTRMNVHEVKTEQPEPTVKTPDRTTGAPEADVVQSSGPPSGSSPHLREFDGRAQADTDKRVDKDSTELVSSDEPRHVIAGRGGAG